MLLTREKKEELISLLVKDIKGVLRYLFNGAGKYSGPRFLIGGTDGSDGDSLYVTLNTGVWKDMATGESGDIIELFKIKFGSFKIGLNEVYSYLRIPRFKESTDKIQKKTFTTPKINWKSIKHHGKVHNYLKIDRKIPDSVISECNDCLKEMNDEKGSWYVFLSYTDEGKLCGAKYTNLKRAEKESGEFKKVEFQSKNPLSSLWGIHTFDSSKFDFVIITEGQIDAMSFKAQGISNAVSVPSGTSNTDWIYNCWDWLSKFKYVYLCFDNDEAGIKSLEVVSKKIGIEKCKNVELPVKYKDPNDAHINSYALRLSVDAAKEFKPDRLVSVLDLYDKSWDIIAGGRREERGIPFCGWKDDDSILFKLRQAELTLYTGYPGSGKSALLYQAIASLIFEYDQKVVVASLEETSDQLAVLIAINAIGRSFAVSEKDKSLLKHLYEYIKGRLFFYDFRGRAPYKGVMATAEYAIRRHGCQHFIFDSIAKTDLNIEDNAQVNDFIGLVCSSMDETGAHYHVVAHAKKGNDKEFSEIPSLQDVKGAASIGIEAFNCVTMWRNKPKEAMLSLGEKNADNSGSFRKKGYQGNDGKQYNLNEIRRDWADNLLIVSKQKVGGKTGQYELWFNRDTYSYTRSFSQEITPMYKQAEEEEDTSVNLPDDDDD
jgi:twinkle protein